MIATISHSHALLLINAQFLQLILTGSWLQFKEINRHLLLWDIFLISTEGLSSFPSAQSTN